MAGFGRSKFGGVPFGKSDVGLDTLISTFNPEYFDETIKLSPGETITDNNKDPLLKLLKTYRNSVNLRRDQIDKMPQLVDYDKAPLEIVRLFGDMLGLGIDKNDPEFLQRSFLGNASQWLQIKSTNKGYSVRGLASGFDVEVDNFWRIDPMYIPFIPARNRFLMKPQSADESALPLLHCDMPPGTFVGTPSEEDETYAKSAQLRIVFTVAEPRIDGVDYNALLDLVIDKIKDVVAIHHEIFRIVFQIRINVKVPDITVSLLIEESSIFNHMVQNLFDTVPADDVPMDDGHLTVEIVGIFDATTFDIGASLSMSAQIFESYDIPPNVFAPQTLSFTIGETDIPEVEVIYKFDSTASDVIPADLQMVTITIT